MTETDCLFCKILAGTAAADVVYQDPRCIVIRDVNPQAPAHLLVIPREHMDSLDDASQKDARRSKRRAFSFPKVLNYSPYPRRRIGTVSVKRTGTVVLRPRRITSTFTVSPI